MIPATKTRKSEETRLRILDAALELFRARGFEQTTMRAIAERAGVATGNAYYYFTSKEHFVQEFYARTQDNHVVASRRVLANTKSFGDRLRGVMHAKIDTVEPFHNLAAALFRSIAAPGSPLHPLGPEAAEPREAAIAIFAETLDGSDARVPGDLKAELPRLLWLYHLGVLLFWIHDTSAGRRRTRTLVDGTARLVATAVALAGNPLLGPLRKRAIGLLREVQNGRGDEARGQPRERHPLTGSLAARRTRR